MQRPGLIQAAIFPMALSNQSNPAARQVQFIRFPAGKTDVGGTQWAIKAVQRPGLARSNISPSK